MMESAYPKFQRGASIVHWLLALTVLLGFGALAIDLNNVYVSEAELQNAADAGALEGARLLFCPDGTINSATGSCVDESGTQILYVDGSPLPSANLGATAAAQANLSQGTSVEVLSVERGHWEFKTTNYQDANGIERGGLFTANASTTPGDLLDSNGNFRTFQAVNLDTDVINAIRVVTARQGTPIAARFAQLLGIGSFQSRASAVAYIGFAGKIRPGEVDWPLAMCLDNVNDSCSVGRMIPDTGDTGGWTNFEQAASGCNSAASANSVKSLITSCGSGLNIADLILGWDMETNNGQIDVVFNQTFDCWSKNTFKWGPNWINGKLSELDTDGDGQPDQPWKWVLPVIDCTSHIGSCNTLVGAVEVDVLWILDDTTNLNKLDDDAPRSMSRTDASGNTVTWTASGSADVEDPDDGLQRWNSFVAAFDLREPNNSPAQWRQKTIYFAPSCSPADPFGGTGGANFGVRSNEPVLVY